MWHTGQSRAAGWSLAAALLLSATQARAQEWPPYECDERFGDCGGLGACGENSSSGSGCGCGSTNVGAFFGVAVDLGDTYQYADDYDDDGIEDFFDNCPYVPNRDQASADGDVLGDECDDDDDDDEVVDASDNCPSVANPMVDGVQVDTDRDGLGDACDTDDDGDGVEDLADNCPLIANPEQRTISDAGCYADMDGDGVYDHRDNCIADLNPEQVDTDGDNIGDECDPDIDGDGVLNTLDSCPLVAQTEQIDTDRDGLGEECDDTYCYVVMGDEANCLDPEGAFRVYSPSLQNVQTGETVRLRLFANRENAPILYRWTVTQAPAGSLAKVSNDSGVVRCSTPYEYHYFLFNVPTFTPDEPGEYALRLEATQVWEDAVSGDLGQTSEAISRLVVEDDSLNSGCSAVPRRYASGGSAFVLLSIVAALIALRRARAA